MTDRTTDKQLEFQRQWELCEPHVYAYVRSLVFQHSDAQDLAQDVADILWQKFDEFETGTRFDHWALATARNRVLNFRKKKASRNEVLSDEVVEALADDVLQGNYIEILEVLQGCVEKLPDDKREWITRRFEPKATNRSVAHALGMSESSVSRRLKKIYEILMNCVTANTR